MRYVGRQPRNFKRFIFTASGGETSVSTADNGDSIQYFDNNVDVHLNGIKLVRGDDFTIASDGGSIDSLSALVQDDVVEVTGYFQK